MASMLVGFGGRQRFTIQVKRQCLFRIRCTGHDNLDIVLLHALAKVLAATGGDQYIEIEQGMVLSVKFMQ